MALGKIQHLYNIYEYSRCLCFRKTVVAPDFMMPKTLRVWPSLLSNVRTQFAEFLVYNYLSALVFSTYEPVSV